MAFNSLLNAVKKGAAGVLKMNPLTAPIVNAAPQIKTAVTQTFPAIQKSIQSSPMASARPGETKAVPSTQQNQVTDAQLASARAQNPMPQVASVAPAPATPRVGSLPVSQMSAEEKRMATLVNPQTGERKAVAVGSPDANNAFGQGFVLEGSQEETMARKMSGVEKPIGNLPSADGVSTGALAQTPPASSAPVVSAGAEPDPLLALQQKYLAQFAPSDEERSLADKIAMTSENIAGLEGQGRGISLGMIRGQQGALRSKGLAPLEARLGALVGARQAEAAQTGAMLGFEEKAQQRASEQAMASKQEMQSLAQLAAQNGATPEQVQAILASGDYNTALQTATPFLQQKTTPKYETVGAGQTLIDPATGQVIYQAPVTAKGGSGGGAGGSSGGLSGGTSALAQAVLSGTLNLEDLTPTQRGQIASELAAGGYQRTANVSAGTRETIAKFDNVLAQAQNADNLINSLNTGPIASRLGSLGQITGTGSNEFTQYKSAISNLSSILLNQLSGAAVAPSEATRLMGFIPSVNDQQNVAKEKLRLFQAGIQQAQQAYLNRATQTSQQLAASGQQAGGEIDPLGVRN